MPRLTCARVKRFDPAWCKMVTESQHDAPVHYDCLEDASAIVFRCIVIDSVLIEEVISVSLSIGGFGSSAGCFVTRSGLHIVGLHR